MSLFVCGLLTYPSMQFSDWIASASPAAHKAYADAFFDDIFIFDSAKIQFERILSTAGTADLDAISQETAVVPGSCFLYARENNASNTHHENILILDAFSHENQFFKYVPAVWHLYCLWQFQSEPNMRCYAARVASTTFVFITHYAQHVQDVKNTVKNPINGRAQAVRELVVRPLELYRSSLNGQTLTLPMPSTVSLTEHCGLF
jgi:hypothetical protein